VACHVHSTCLSPGADLMDDFDRDSGKSVRRKLSSSRKHGLTAPPAGAPGAIRAGPEQLHHVLDQLHHLAGINTGSSSSTSSTCSSSSSENGSPDAAGHLQSAKACLLAACKAQDRWHLLQCGEWEDHKGWSGPAHVLLQVWPMAAATAVVDEVHLEYDIWEVGPDWLPTGVKFASGTGEAEDTRTVTGADLLQAHPMYCTRCTHASVALLSEVLVPCCHLSHAMHAGRVQCACAAACPSKRSPACV
jgi:hypothetical protein